MMSELREFFSDYAAIGVGLMIGSLAYLGRLLVEGKMPTWIQVTGYLLQMGLVGLIASIMAKGLSSDYRALSAALLALSANEVIQLAKKRAKAPFLRFLVHSLEDEIDGEKDKGKKG
jgi:hypothetical protein